MLSRLADIRLDHLGMNSQLGCSRLDTERFFVMSEVIDGQVITQFGEG